jgi:CubicO group peptidase (beta-lactamase class C family)
MLTQYEVSALLPQPSTHATLRMRILTLGLLLGAVGACQQKAEAPVATPAGDARIGRVVAGLRPIMTVKGTPASSYALGARMTHHKVPAVSIAVVDSGRIAWTMAVGLKEAGTSDSVTPTTLFQAASISKPIAASVMLRLVGDGRLALDTPVTRYLKSWTLPRSPLMAKEPVTLRRLASHSAGFGVHGFPGYEAGAPVPTVPQILDGIAPTATQPVRLEHIPGSKFSYSGGGVTIEQLVMTDVTGEAFPALASRLILAPAGMTHSFFEQPLSAARAASAAAGHRPDGSMLSGRWHTYPELAAAGLWTTPTDLLKWAMAIAAARAGKSGGVISQHMATAMLAPQKGPAGIGPMIEGTGDAFKFGHDGANEGYVCQLIYFPALGRGAAIMSNSDNGVLTQEILYAIAKEYQWPEYGPREIVPVPFDSATIAQLIGEYPEPLRITQGKQTSQFVSYEGGKLMVEVPGFVPRTAMVLLAGDRLISPEIGYEFSLIRDRRGRITSLDLGSAIITKK